MRETVFRFLSLLEESWGLGWVPLWVFFGGGRGMVRYVFALDMVLVTCEL